MLAHAPRPTNSRSVSPSRRRAPVLKSTLDLGKRPAAGRRRLVPETGVGLGCMVQHERARGPALERLVGERGLECVERALIVPLPEPEFAQRVEVVAAGL